MVDGAGLSASSVELAGHRFPVQTNEQFLADDKRRYESFVTNFGNWDLPSELVQQLGTTRVHLEWVHDTGEVVLLAAVPHMGAAEVEVPKAEGVADELGGLGGGVTSMVLPSSDPGMVRELFASEVVPAGSRVVVLAHVEHGLRVHEMLWGWHLHHRDRDGWDWLLEHLFGSGLGPAGA
jgi:hypothetical protein